MANSKLYLMGIVKENKNKTLYIDVEQGRVFLGKISGFTKGQELMGEAIVSERTVDYPATPAVGTPGTPEYRPAQAARQEKGYSLENFYSEEQLTKKIEYETRKAKAAFATARVNSAISSISGVKVESLEDVLALVG